MNDQQLAECLRLGERAAWLELYDRHAAALWRHVGRILAGDASATADVVQNTFLAAATSARSFDPSRGTAWMWLWGIGRRQALMHFRAARCRVASSRLDVSAAAEWLAGSGAAPQELLESAETARAVQAALAHLSDDDAFILAAAYMEGASMAGVAALLGKSVEATRSHAARARRNFREAFMRIAEPSAGSAGSSDHVTRLT